MATRIKISAKINRQFKQLRALQSAVQTQLGMVGTLQNAIWDAVQDSDPDLEGLAMVYNHRKGVLEFANEHQERLYAERLLAKTKQKEE
jgi:hypothetical protein